MTVVVGYIPNKYGRAALAAAIQEARRRNTGLVVVNATKGDAAVDKRYVGADAAAKLDAKLAASGVPYELRQSVSPDVADEIVAVIEETQAAVVVIGLRHRSQVGKMLMGSVAQRVLMNAPCHVLAVKP